MKIRLMGTELFQADGQTDGRTDRQMDRETDTQTGGWIDMKKLIIVFLNFAEVPKNNKHLWLKLLFSIF
jgi:hypothetical protein